LKREGEKVGGGSSERDYVWRQERCFSGFPSSPLEVPMQCPLVLLVEVNLRKDKCLENEKETF
jgi:hypothetical protein